MAFSRRRLVPLAAGFGSFTLWHYDAGEDGPEAVQEPNYFLDVRDWLRKNDRLFIVASNGERSFDAMVETSELDNVQVLAVKTLFHNGAQNLSAIQKRNASKDK